MTIAIAMIGAGGFDQALALAKEFEGSKLARIHALAARAMLKRGRLAEARRTAGRAAVADRVRILVEISEKAGKAKAGPILTKAETAAEDARDAVDLLALVAFGEAKQGWTSLVREAAAKHVPKIEGIRDLDIRGRAFVDWVRAQVAAHDFGGAAATARKALAAAERTVATPLKNPRPFRPNGTAKHRALQAATDFLALAGDLKEARAAARRIAKGPLRALALASAARHAREGERLRQ